jgi:hypothetical protein
MATLFAHRSARDPGVNQIQLTEHTFAYREHEVVWDASP